MIKNYLLIVILSVSTIAVSAQTKSDNKAFSTESNIKFGCGAFYETGKSKAEDTGFSCFLSYGLDISLGQGWSVMPEVGYRAMNSIFAMCVGDEDGGDNDIFKTLDISLNARHHFALNNGREIVLGIAPVYSVALYRDKYYIDADPGDPLNDKAKIKKGFFSVKPSVEYKLSRHWYVGAEALFGIGNAAEQYPSLNYTPIKHLNHVNATISFHF